MGYLLYFLFMLTIANIQYLAFDGFNGAVITLLNTIVASLYFILLDVKK